MQRVLKIHIDLLNTTSGVICVFRLHIKSLSVEFISSQIY